MAIGGIVMLAGSPVVAAFAAGVTRPSVYSPPGDVRRGAQIAQSTCLSCHGAETMTFGDPAFHAPRLGHQRLSYLFYALQDYRAGRRRSEVMGPVAKGLTDQQMRDVAAYFAQGTLPIPQLRLGNTPSYRLAISRCAICHGETGLGEVDGMPILTGQDRSYLEYALKQYRSGGRSEATMRAVVQRLSPADASLLTGYYSAQQGLGR